MIPALCIWGGGGVKSFTRGCFVITLIKISPAALGAIFYSCQYIVTTSLLSFPWKRAWPAIWTNLNASYARLLWATFGWNWPNGSEEEGFSKFLPCRYYFPLIKGMVFHLLLSKNSWCQVTCICIWRLSSIIFIRSLLSALDTERHGMILVFTQECFVPTLVKNGSVVLEKMFWKLSRYFHNIALIFSL